MLRNSIKIALGVAALAATGAATAATLPATAANSFLVSGSTALNNQFYANILAGPNTAFPATVSQFCTPGSITVYSNIAPGKGGLPKAHQAVIVCTANAAFTGAVGPSGTIAFAKESNGGSNEGTFNIAQNVALPIWNTTVAPTGCVASTDAGIGAGGAVPGGFYYAHQMPFTEFNSCTGPFTNQVPEVGLADEDPALFNVGLKVVTPTVQNNLNTQPMFQNGFGIAVSLQLYRAMQRAQGLTLDDKLADMPNLSKATIRGLYTGFTTSWTQVTSGTGVAINSTTLTNGVSISATPFLCRRGDNSGTNASVDIYFLGNRCMAGNIAMKQVTTSPANCAGLVAPETPEDNGCTWAAANLADAVFAGTSSGDVATCLNAHDQANQFAIGALGTTSKFDDVGGLGGLADGGSNQWRYVRIDGALPTVLAQSNGTNDYAMDNVLNMNVNAVSPAVDFGNYVVQTLTTAIPLGDTLVLQPGGDANFVTGGLLDANNPNGLSSNSPAVTVAQVTANPVSTLTRSPSGAVNNCQSALPNASKLEFQQF
jgi:hypothetical protein